jgi:hypothetical protein
MPFETVPTAAPQSCPRCRLSLLAGQQTVDCPACGRRHHARCWQSNAGCSAVDCPDHAGGFAPTPPPLGEHPPLAETAVEATSPAPAGNHPVDSLGDEDVVLTISTDDLDRAIPERPRRSPSERSRPASRAAPSPRSSRDRSTGSPESKPLNGLAVASFLTGLAGTVCVGIITGVVAIVLGVLAVARLRTGRERGIVFAATGVVLGVFDVVLWGAALVLWLSPGPGAAPADPSDDLEVDLAALAQLDPPLRRAMLANVLIRVHSGGLLGGEGMGSGVILQLNAQSAWVLTNRHVVDPDYSDRTHTVALPGTVRGTVEVKLVGQPLQPGQVIWTAPDGIDLAVVQTNVVPVPDAPARPAEADWESLAEPRIGDEVFAVGNPQGLGWTHTQGTVSQFRTQPKGNRQVRLVQTSTAINPGNSGGGLYDSAGRLIGINTATIDKRVADGLSFAIDFKTFLAFRVPFLRPAAGAAAP